MNTALQRQLYFNQPADQWAITHLLSLTTRDQLHLALHILGLISSSKAEYRKLSLSRLAVDLGYSRSTVKPLKARMVSAGLLIELVTPGRSSLYGVGPAFESESYSELLQQFEHLAKLDQLNWPFNSSRKQGAAAVNPQPGQSERPGTWPVRAARGWPVRAATH